MPNDDLERSDKVQKQHFRSTVSFPYSNLEEVAAIAKAIYGMGGVPMTRDQIANVMNSSPDSSTFNVKLSSARIFGVLTPATDGKFVLSDVGAALASDGPEAAQARVDAFLNVELYSKLVEHFQGKKLPPAKGLEAAIIAIGVSERQGEKARQAFERSASYAGYFNATKDRLVAPILSPVTVPPKELGQDVQVVDVLSTRNANLIDRARVISAGFDPLIEGMLQRLPEPSTEWPMQQRVRWLRTFAANLSEVYRDDVAGEIVVKFIPDATLADPLK